MKRSPEIPADLAAGDTTLMAERAIDTAVVNGEVDGQERRVGFPRLAVVAFQGYSSPGYVVRDFRRALLNDERFVDRVPLSQYGYRPELSPDSAVRASRLAIVSGMARCSDAEYVETFELMNELADAVYALHAGQGITTIRGIGGMLHQHDIFPPDLDVWEAFKLFMEQDSRFHVVSDGRVVLTGVFTGDLEDIRAAERIQDIDELLRDILPSLVPGGRGTFTESDLLSKLKFRGIIVPHVQVPALFSRLAGTEGVEVLGDKTYRLLSRAPRPSAEPKPRRAREPTLDEKLGAIGLGPDKGAKNKRSDWR